MNALLLALVLVSAPRQSTMFNQIKPAIEKQVEKKLADRQPPDFNKKLNEAGKRLSVMYTEKIGDPTTVVGTYVAEGSPNMGFILFKTTKVTFALLMVEENGELKVLPRDFTESTEKH